MSIPTVFNTTYDPSTFCIPDGIVNLNSTLYQNVSDKQSIKSLIALQR